MLAEEAEKGKLNAQRKAKKKVDWEVWLRERLEKLIDNIEPLELIAIGSVTFVVHDILLTADAFQKKLEDMSEALRNLSGAPEWYKFFPLMNTPLGWIANIPFLGYKLATGKAEGEAAAEVAGATLSPLAGRDSMWLWLFSFGIAYILITTAKNFDAISAVNVISFATSFIA